MLEARSHGGNGFFFEKRVLDCFAGSGSFGLESVSRGAEHAYFIDSNSEAISLIHINSKKIKAENFSTIIRSDVLNLKKNRDCLPVDLVFLDPPYGKVSIRRTLNHLLHTGWISEKTTVITEENIRNVESLDGYTKIASKTIGNTVFGVFESRSE
jgi:16S rRNA (guanine966-N2)-methyltransferase